ncbi:hypothetical protein OMW55_08590 [Sphingomonas sp. BN140010]|uniref:Haemolysin activator HlyB C-terminal domain-containing protein n=1 Tax=Sphingomonas arvum TaxID=2992113 RepID=A0ABT3JFL9_9SPHN|nr:hypothetical protein [Sphingomonas sp. BN140010]MCW3797859.1 hypothetical protein [Sphingomonas sp. BN140010]
MSAPTRFLAVAVAGWVTFRAAASVLPLPALALPQVAPASDEGTPSAQPPAFEAPLSYAPLSPPPAAPVIPASYATAPWPPQGYPMAVPYPAAMRYPVPRYVPAAMPAYYQEPPPPSAMPQRGQSPWLAPAPEGVDFSGMPEAEEAPVSRMAAVSLPLVRPGRSATLPSFAAGGPPRLDRWSLTSWALMRQEQASLDGSGTQPALAAGGQLGGSQAGVRLGYRFNRHLGVNLRFSAPIPAPGAAQTKVNGEAALGVAWQPLSALPVRFMAERRQRVGGPEGGRNAFALLAEGGVYGRALPLGFKLDGYGQSGIVSLRQRDWFVDGAVTASRPLLGRYSVGLGAWGGAQRGLARLDVGPRVSMRLLPGIKAHVDYRWQALGKARPGSGYALTVAGDF